MRWYEDPVYIKMSEKAEEIQKNWKTKAFDIYQSKEGIIRVVSEDYGCEFAPEGISSYGWEKEVIWLPTQSQLQEMIGQERFVGHWDGEYFNPRCFYVWYDENFLYCATNFASMEQLWLAFVMFEKYNKTWNGEDWIENAK